MSVIQFSLRLAALAALGGLAVWAFATAAAQVGVLPAVVFTVLMLYALSIPLGVAGDIH